MYSPMRVHKCLHALAYSLLSPSRCPTMWVCATMLAAPQRAVVLQGPIPLKADPLGGIITDSTRNRSKKKQCVSSNVRYNPSRTRPRKLNGGSKYRWSGVLSRIFLDRPLRISRLLQNRTTTRDLRMKKTFPVSQTTHKTDTLVKRIPSHLKTPSSQAKTPPNPPPSPSPP